MTSSAAPTVLTAPTDTLARLADYLMTRLRGLDAWLAFRRRAAQDRQDLATMSERELADIGVSRSSIDAVADGGWTRDTFC